MHVGGTPSTAAVRAGPGAAVGVEVTHYHQQQCTPSQASVLIVSPLKGGLQDQVSGTVLQISCVKFVTV